MNGWYKAVACVLTLFLALSALLNVWQHKKRYTANMKVVTDTVRVIQIDTVPYYRPVAKDSIVVKYITARLPVSDSLPNHFAGIGKMVDSLNVELPIEQKRYEDSTYTAFVSGYRPQLDSIFVYPRREVITISTERTAYKYKSKRFGFGVQAGYGITPKGAQPYIGIGVNLNLFSF